MRCNQAYQEGFANGKDEYLRAKKKKENEYAYYLHVTKKYGWYVGIGQPLKEEDISHIPTYSS